MQEIKKKKSKNMKIYLIWILLAESLTFAQSYSSSLCFSHRYGISKICSGKSDDLFCNHDEVIMINTIRYAKSDYKQKGSCYECPKNETMSTWEIDPTPFKNRLYQLCSQQNNCSFDEEVESPCADEREERYLWKAIISYDCVSSGLINDICSPLDTVLEKTTDTVYLSLHEHRRIIQYCSCIIIGDVRGTNITVIDYRPYYKDFKCKNSSVFVNGKPLLQCLNTSNTDSALYNMPVNVTDSRTNITVSKYHMLPHILWISVKGLDSTIQCNIEDKGTTAMTSSLTPVSLTGTTAEQFTTTISTVTTSVTEGTTDVTTNLSSSQHGNSEVFPSSMIAGTSAGLIALVSVTLTACLLYRRRSRRMSEHRSKEVVYSNETHHEAEHLEESRIDGGTNRAREDGDGLYVNMSNNLPQDQESNTVYLNMGHQALHEANAKHKEETIRDVTYQNENREHGAEEPHYKNITRGKESESNYCKLNKTDENTHEYNYFTGINTH